MRARKDPVDDVEIFLTDQALDLVDRNVGLALSIGFDQHDLVLAADAALVVAEIDRDLGADRRSDRAAGRERTGQVVGDPDA